MSRTRGRARWLSLYMLVWVGEGCGDCRYFRLEREPVEYGVAEVRSFESVVQKPVGQMI
jgi:hypothetical protein